MKKVKIMLSAIAVFAIVSGAMALNLRSGQKLWCDTPGGVVTCTEERDALTTFNNGQFLYNSSCTTISEGDCSPIDVYQGQ